MTKQKNAKGAGRPSEIADARLWRGYISGANYDFINRLGPRQASEQVRLAITAAEAGSVSDRDELVELRFRADEARRNELACDAKWRERQVNNETKIADLSATGARLERELAEARGK